MVCGTCHDLLAVYRRAVSLYTSTARHIQGRIKTLGHAPHSIGAVFGLDLRAGYSPFPALVLHCPSGCGTTQGSFLMTISAQLIGFGSIPTARYGMAMSLAYAPALHRTFNIAQPLPRRAELRAVERASGL